MGKSVSWEIRMIALHVSVPIDSMAPRPRGFEFEYVIFKHA